VNPNRGPLWPFWGACRAGQLPGGHVVGLWATLVAGMRSNLARSGAHFSAEIGYWNSITGNGWPPQPCSWPWGAVAVAPPGPCAWPITPNGFGAS